MLVWRKDAGAWWECGGWWPGHERGPRREQQVPVCIFESVPCLLCGPKPCSPVFQSLRRLLLTSERVHLTSHTGLWRSCVRLPAGLPHRAWKALDPTFLSKFRFFSKERKQQRNHSLLCPIWDHHRSMSHEPAQFSFSWWHLPLPGAVQTRMRLRTPDQHCTPRTQNTPETHKARTPHSCSTGHGGCLGVAGMRQAISAQGRWGCPELGLPGHAVRAINLEKQMRLQPISNADKRGGRDTKKIWRHPDLLPGPENTAC